MGAKGRNLTAESMQEGGKKGADWVQNTGARPASDHIQASTVNKRHSNRKQR